MSDLHSSVSWCRPVAEAAVLAVLAALPLVSQDYLLLLTQVAVLALFTLSLELLVGQAGILSLGHAAFFGIGAYAAAFLALAGWEEPISGLLIAGGIAGLAGLAMAPLVLRASGLTQLMVTLCLGLMLHEAASRGRDWTGGDDGLSGFLNSPVLGLFEFDLFGVTGYLYALAVLGLCFAAFSLMRAAPFGTALRGIRQNPVRMAALGTPVGARLAQAYALSAAMAGLAGALMAETTQSVALEALSFQRSAEVLIVLILGGVGSRYGALIGAAVYVLARDWLSALSPEYWLGWLGLMMMAVVLVAPRGIAGLLARARLPRARAKTEDRA